MAELWEYQATQLDSDVVRRADDQRPTLARASPNAILAPMASVPAARHLLRAKDLADARLFEPLVMADLAPAARLSPAPFSRELRRAFGESPYPYP